jgi:hypothetical protein
LERDENRSSGRSSHQAWGLTDPSLAADTYEEYRRELSPNGLADDKWMKKAMEFILKVTGTNERVSPAKVFDFSLTREAIGRVN